MDQEAKQSIVARLQQANNVLVTVSANPSVDQLAACIGLTLLLNKLGKHATAVFSGAIPSTIEFLKPEQTIEKNTDSLRDFIIALDKSKADKLRYKVEDKVVKIFITPYRTSLSQNDLEFSQGDFNVDAVIGLGVHERVDLDKAITAHGRILHDATVISVNNRDQGNLGSINWVNVAASSLSEMVVDLAHGLTSDPLDAQMATAFMTGIVAETNRFSNEKTSPAAMSMASELMAAGANQQLIATKLDTKPAVPAAPKAAAKPSSEVEIDEEDGSLRIPHTASEDKPVEKPADLPPVADDKPEEGPAPAVTEPRPQPPQPPAGPTISKIREDELPAKPDDTDAQASHGTTGGTSMVLEPPTMGGRLTANSEPEHAQFEPSTDPLSGASLTQRPILNRTPMGTTLSDDKKDESKQPEPTLSSIEQSVDSPHLKPMDEVPAQPAIAPTPEPSTSAPMAATPPPSAAPEPAPEPAKEPEPLQSADAPQQDDSEDKDEEIAEAREAVDDAITEAGDQPLEPVQSLGAQPLGLNLHDQPAMAPAESTPTPNTEQATDPLAPAPQVPTASPSPDSNGPSATPYFPPTEPATPMGGPLFNTAQNPIVPSPPATPDAMNPAPAPVGQGIAPNIPPQLMPTTPPVDTTAAPGNPAPPPVPPPMMPPAAGGSTSFNAPL